MGNRGDGGKWGGWGEWEGGYLNDDTQGKKHGGKKSRS